MMNKNDVVAVIMGGPSAEREISLVTGAAIAGALREKGYNVAEIDLEPKKLALQLEECSAKVVFNAVHGMYGEDGRLQTLLEMLEIPYTGSGMLASALGMDKAASKRIMQAAGIATPKSLIFVKGETHDFCGEILSAFKKMPVVVKPATQGSSIGVEIVKNDTDINSAMEKAFTYSREVVVEEFKEEAKMIHIRAIIYVERDSQKGIIIGKQGKALKKVATEARRDLERFFGKTVFLETYVKVDKDWRSSDKELRNFGYQLD